MTRCKATGRSKSPGYAGDSGVRRLPQIAATAALLALALTAVAAPDPGETTATTHAPAAVRRILDAHGIPAESLSLYVHEVGRDAPMLAVNADTPRNPASTIKMLTTFAALELLGPAYTWRTEIYLLGPLRDGRLEGDLLIKGYGDPFLVSERLWLLLQGLRQRGLQHVTGDLVIDSTQFAPDPDDPAAFDGQPYRTYNVLPYALLVNFQSVNFLFEPDTATGAVRIRPDPVLANLRIDNRLKLKPGRCGGYQRGIAMHAESEALGGDVTFSGRFPEGCRYYSMTRAVLEPAAFAYGAIKGLWEQMGGQLDGGLRLGQAPEVAVPFMVFRSPSLAEIVRSINKHSNNVMTRQLLMTLGAERFGPPGTRANGIAAVDEWLDRRGLASPELVLENGAGLSRATRISARHLGQILLAARASAFAPEFLASLPLAAMDGTLQDRFTDRVLAGRLRLKTGRLDHVYGLAGYARTPSDRVYVVVVLHNYEDVHRGPGEEVQEALVRWLFASELARAGVAQHGEGVVPANQLGE